MHRPRQEIEADILAIETLDDPTGDQVEELLVLYAERDSLDVHEIRK